MKPLICDKCKERVHKLSFSLKEGGWRCESCKESSVSPLYLGIDVFPAEGIFLEHVSPQGKRFFSRNEMRQFEKETGTLIGCLH